MTAQRWHFLLFCAVLLTGSAALAAQEAKVSVQTIFSALSFRPHFPDEKDFVAKYGEGFVLREGGERFRIYYLPETSLWLRLEIEENRVESYVVGILLSKLPLSSERRSPWHEIAEVTIRGVKLGDLPSKLENLFGKPLREYKADLGPNRHAKRLARLRQTSVSGLFESFLRSTESDGFACGQNAGLG